MASSKRLNNAAVIPYRYRSQSATALAGELDTYRVCRRRLEENPSESLLVRHDGIKYLINWGCTRLPNYIMNNSSRQFFIANHPDAVAVVANKLKFFQKFGELLGTDVPLYFDSPSELPVRRDLIAGLDHHFSLFPKDRIFARTELNGHSGQGIVIIRGQADWYEKRNSLENCQLFVAEFPKTHEYRVHFFGGKIIDHTRKARRRSTPDDRVNWDIRNHRNGFVFVREGGAPLPSTVQSLVEEAVTHSFGLDFGAMDVLYCNRTDRAFICEVNSAPGLEGTTLARYVEAFRSILEENEA